MPKAKPKKKPVAKKPVAKKAAKAPARKPAKAKPTPAKKPTSSTSSSDYSTYRDSQAGISRARSAAGREIGPIPDIADVDRRRECSASLRRFCEVYNPEAFALAWSDDHLRAIARIEESGRLGALFAVAMPRGSGKTTLCRMAALWLVSNAVRRYAFVIGATDAKARETLDTIRILIRFLPDFAADYPEISVPAQKLGGIANRSSGQTCQGQSTLIEWSSDRVVLPTVPPPANWPKDWPLRADGMVPTSGVLVSASGLTGEGIRGSLKTLTTGEMVRPDFVLLDDPQTPESARSLTQNQTRLSLITADVLGLAGPGKAIAGVMPCTVIEQGDMVDEVLDREKHPLWRGERSGILKSMPVNLQAWDGYFEVYARCAQLEPPDLAEANAYYLAHRAELDAGAEASWEARKQPDEVSAIQSAMHLFFRDRRAFQAEYMNQPLASNPAAAAALDPDLVAAKVTNVSRGVVPRVCTRLVAFVDSGGDLLWYSVVALDERFGGGPILYGVYPEQARSYFAKGDPRPSLKQLPEVRGQSEDAALFAALGQVVNRIVGTAYVQEETGVTLRVERCLVDANWGEKTDLVYDFCRRSPWAAVLLPSHGKFIGASSNPMASWQKKPGETAGLNWRILPGDRARGKHVVFDSNHWKTFLADRLRSPAGSPGCWHLHAPGQPGAHRMIADHCAAEYPVEVTGRGRRVDEWKLLVGRDNDWFDCLVGCAVAASTLGIRWDPGTAVGAPPTPPATPIKRVKWSERQKAKGGAR